MFTAAQCKSHIATLSSTFARFPPSGWKRTTTYSDTLGDDSCTFFEFAHPDGNALTLVDSGGQLRVYSYQPAPMAGIEEGAEGLDDSPWGQKKLDHIPEASDIFAFMTSCTLADPQILAPEPGAQAHVEAPDAWILLESYGSMYPQSLYDVFDNSSCEPDVENLHRNMLELFYPNELGYPMWMSPHNLQSFHLVALSAFADTEQYYVFVLHDNTLILGSNPNAVD